MSILTALCQPLVKCWHYRKKFLYKANKLQYWSILQHLSTTSRRVEEARARSWQFEELSAGDALACLKSERLTSSQQPGMRAINRHTMPSVAFTRYSCSLKSFEKQTQEFHNNFYYCFIYLNWNPLRNFNPTCDCQNEKLFIAGSLALVFHYDAHCNHHLGTISRWAD